MRISCSAQELKNICAIAEKISGKHATLPILNTLLFAAEKGRFKIASTNLEMGFEGWVPAQVHEDGQVAVSSRTATGFLSAAPAARLTLESEGEHLRVRSEGLSTLIHGQAPDEFPRFPTIIKKQHTCTLPAFTLGEGLRSVLFAAAVSDIKPEIASVYVTSKKNTSITFVATDAFRLACREYAYPNGETLSILLPLRGATELARMLEETDGDVVVECGDGQALFTHRAFRFTTRLTDGVYPDYQQIVPKRFATEATLARATLLQTLRSAGVFAGRLQAATLRFHPDDGLIEVQTSAAEVGEHNESLHAASLTGESAQLAFNHRYLIDGLAHIGEGAIRIGLAGEGKPMVLRGQDDPSYFHIIMPMKNI